MRPVTMRRTLPPFSKILSTTDKHYKAPFSGRVAKFNGRSECISSLIFIYLTCTQFLRFMFSRKLSDAATGPLPSSKTPGFSLFPQLPGEIQLAIWNATITPRIIRVEAGGGKAPPAMFACKAAYLEISQYYHPYRFRNLNNFGGDFTLFVNYDIDILFFTAMAKEVVGNLRPSSGTLCPIELGNGTINLMTYIGMGSQREDFVAPFKRVLLSQEDCWCIRPPKEASDVRLWQCSVFYSLAKIFPEVRELLFTSYCCHDDSFQSCDPATGKLCFSLIEQALKNASELESLTENLTLWKSLPRMSYVEVGADDTIHQLAMKGRNLVYSGAPNLSVTLTDLQAQIVDEYKGRVQTLL